MIDKLDDSNFILFAAKYYDNPQCFDTLEFQDDLKRFKYLKRLFTRYQETGELKERLIVNHLIVLYNVFGPEATRMLFFKLEGFHHYLKPFIVLLGYMPEVVRNIGVENKTYRSSDIPMDEEIIELLRKI
jgi:hypothetical protein